MTESEVKTLLAGVLQDLAKKTYDAAYGGDFQSHSFGDAAYLARMVLLSVSTALEGVAVDLGESASGVRSE